MDALMAALVAALLTQATDKTCWLAAKLGIGAITAEHWMTFYKDMVECGALPAAWAVDRLLTTQFVNKKVAML